MPMTMKGKKRRGFTLVELIVVIGVLLTLSILATVAYSNWREEAERAAISSDANALCRAINVYNSIAKTPLTAVPTGTTSGTSTVYTLELTTADGVTKDLDMSVNVPTSRATTVASWIKYNSTTKTFYVEEPAAGGGGGGE